MPNISQRKYRHLGRIEQIPVYLGKNLRSFMNQNEWKVLPMSAIVAALVAMVVRRSMFKTMEGTLMGAFALVCVSIWNGCFNSIQVICRERQIVKREHRSGLHISSYIIAHMIYQAFLCLVQSCLTLYVCRQAGMDFPKQGFMTPYLILDIGISIFLITFSSDMLSLLISALSHSTTAAMTVMPFILIFQLVFSGGFFTLPKRAESFAKITISNYGLKAVASQANYNELPMASGWNTLYKLKGEYINGTVTLGDALDLLQNEDKELIRQFRSKTIKGEEADQIILGFVEDGPEKVLLSAAMEPYRSNESTIGEIVDQIASDPDVIEQRSQSYDFSIQISSIIDLFGEENVREVVEQKASAASYMPEYERSKGNIIACWVMLGSFALLYASLATISLEFIDKDKR